MHPSSGQKKHGGAEGYLGKIDGALGPDFDPERRTGCSDQGQPDHIRLAQIHLCNEDRLAAFKKLVQGKKTIIDQDKAAPKRLVGRPARDDERPLTAGTALEAVHGGSYTPGAHRNIPRAEDHTVFSAQTADGDGEDREDREEAYQPDQPQQDAWHGSLLIR